MRTSHNLLRKQKSSLASYVATSVAAAQTVVLVLLLVTYIFVAHRAGDGKGLDWNRALAVSPRNGVDSFTRLPSLSNHRHGRFLLQKQANDNTMSERPLAVKRGRLDPFNDFHRYRGGYDIESKHYWGSLAVTGIPGYAITVGWLVLGFLLLLSICCARCCWCRRRRPHLTHPAAAPPNVLYFSVTIVIAALLSMAATAGCVALYVGSREFTVEARRMEDALKDAAANATGTINALTVAIVEVEQILKPFSASGINGIGGISLNSLNSTEETLSRESEHISHTVHKNTRVLDKVITALEAVFIVVASLNLVLIVLGSVFGLLHWRRSFYLSASTAWIVTVLTALLFGISFALNNFVQDTCDAMNEYREDPYNTTLDAVLPCQDLLSASGAFADLGQGIRDSLIQVNSTIVKAEGPLNSSLPVLCEQIGPPPTYEYIGSCPNGTIPISDLPEVLEPFKCTSNDTQICSQEGKLLTDLQYTELVAYATGVQTVLNVYPSVGELSNCSIVVQTFDKILDHNCGPIKAAALLVWDAFLTLTISMILLILWWLLLTCLSRELKQDTVVFPVVGSPPNQKREI